MEVTKVRKLLVFILGAALWFYAFIRRTKYPPGINSLGTFGCLFLESRKKGLYSGDRERS